MTTSAAVDTRIYVACLAAYNGGRLHGEWIDVEPGMGGDEIREKVSAMLARSPEPGAEEWAVHDHEGWCGLIDSEWPDFDALGELAEALAEHGEAFGLYCSNVGTGANVDDFRDSYLGEWDSGADFARGWYEDFGDAGELASYVDWGWVWKGEFDCNGWWIDNGHVFGP